MNQIFTFIDAEELYRNCMFASIAHAVMVGSYPLLTSEQSWDGKNYNFQDMNFGKGTISFDEDRFVCVVQKDINYEHYSSDSVAELFDGAEDKYLSLAQEEALEYVLETVNDEVIPAISVAFWGEGTQIYSNMQEEEIIEIAKEMILPLIYSKSDIVHYWKDYYEMSEFQMEFVIDIHNRRMSCTGMLTLQKDEKEKLENWFGDIRDCIESFEEMNIYFK